MTRADAGLPASLTQILARQQNVGSRPQLLLAGISDMTICRRVRDGDWQRLLPGIYVLGGNSVGTEQRRIAATLYAGEGCQLTGLAALHWYGFRYAPATDKIHVLVPHPRRCRSTGFLVVQRTTDLDASPRFIDSYIVVTAARAVIDACRLSGNLESVRAVMTEAVQSHFASIADLEREIKRAKRSRTAIASRVLLEIADGVRSLPESELRQLVSSSKILPSVLWNPILTTPDGERLPTPDGLIPGAWIALEVDSREHHAAGEGWSNTLTRHNRLAERGVYPLHVLPTEIRREPRRVLRQIERTYQWRIQNPVTVDVLVGDPSSTNSVNKGPLLNAGNGQQPGRRSTR